MFIQDPLVAAFTILPVSPTLGISSGILGMELANVVLEARSHPQGNAFVSSAPDPILNSIEEYLTSKRIHLAWNRIVFIGCSAGGDVALRSLMKKIIVPHLPIVIAMHHNPGFKFMTKFQMGNGPSQRIQVAKDGESIRANKVYFLEGDKLHNFKLVTKSFSVLPNRNTPKFHPVIDDVFTNAGIVFKSTAISMILSGMLSDGAEGLKTMSLNGATTLIQEPASAMFKDMPLAAIQSSPLSRNMSLELIAGKINQFSRDDLKYEKLGGFIFPARAV